MESRISDLIDEAAPGDQTAAEELSAALYAELQRVTDIQLQRLGPEFSIGPTTLLQEAYIDLSTREGLQFPDRKRFLRYAARPMRDLMIELVRCARARQQAGGGFEVRLPEVGESLPEPDAEGLEQLSVRLNELAGQYPGLVELVDLHFFCGYTFSEIASIRGVSEPALQHDWKKVRSILHNSLE